MDNKKKVSQEAQGADFDPSLETIEGWLKNDLARAISCLNAIYSDPDLTRQVATWMKGRLDNSKIKKEIQEALPNH